MKQQKRLWGVLLPSLSIFFAPGTGLAERAATVEDTLTKERELHLETSLTYSTSDITQEDVENKFYTLYTGLRYGISEKTQFYARMTGVYDSAQDLVNNTIVTGINKTLLESGEGIGLLGIVETSLLEKNPDDVKDKIYMKTWYAGLTAFQSFEKLSAAMSIAYRLTGARETSNGELDIGNIFYIGPSITFVLNDKLTLAPGVTYSKRAPDKENGDKINNGVSQTSGSITVGYSASKNMTLQLIPQYIDAEAPQSAITMYLSYKIR